MDYVARTLIAVLILLFSVGVGATPLTSDELRLYVKFQDDSGILAHEGSLALEPDSETAPQQLAEVTLLGVAGSWSAVHSVSVDQLRTMRQRGEANLHDGRRLPDLTTEFYLVVPRETAPADLISRLQAHPIVEAVYETQDPAPASFPNFQALQGYLQHPADGVGATTVWNETGATGSGVTVGIIELGMYFQHLGLPSITHAYGWGSTLSSDEEHGVASAGIIVALDDNQGTIGIAHGAALTYFAPRSAPNTPNVPGAITAAIASLSAGDILAIVLQYPTVFNGGPVEYFSSDYNAIKTAVANGIVVVLAAGNGSNNLDTYPIASGSSGHYPFSPANDSGAIYVGAGAPPNHPNQAPRSRLSFSNYGSRVNVQAHGAHVFTTGYGDYYDGDGRPRYYTAQYAGTSSATPIVAGAAALAQSAHLATFGTKASPAAIRSALVATGVPQDSSVFGNIGPQVSATGAVFHLTATPPHLVVQDWYCWGMGDGTWSSTPTATRYQLRGTTNLGYTQIFYDGPNLSADFTVGETNHFDARACRANPGEGCTKWSASGGTVHYHSTCW